MKLIILAAGKGKRLNSEVTHIPKVMREALGKPLLKYVLEAADFVPPDDTIAVVGYEKEQIMTRFPELSYAVQTEQLGTGHAVLSAEPLLKDYDGNVIVLNGDSPLVKTETLKKLIEYHEKNGNDCTLLSCDWQGNVPAYGRVIRDEKGSFKCVIEEKDCTEEQKKIRELCIGFYMFNSKKLFEALHDVKPSKATGEYYITEVPLVMAAKGMKIDAFAYGDDSEYLGVNTEEDLKIVEKTLGDR